MLYLGFQYPLICNGSNLLQQPSHCLMLHHFWTKRFQTVNQLNCLKYVDDTTVLSISCNPDNCSLQTSADLLVSWRRHYKMLINDNKTKEMLIISANNFPQNELKTLISMVGLYNGFRSLNC